MPNPLDKHISYKGYPSILATDGSIIREDRDQMVRNGLGLRGRLYLRAQNQKILIPTLLHPMLLSAVGDDQNEYVVDHDGQQNGPFLGVGCTKWLQDFAVTVAKIFESKKTQEQELYKRLNELNTEDVTKHGRIGEGLYILFDLIKAYKDGQSYHSPTMKEYKVFMADLQNICNGKKTDVSGYIDVLPSELIKTLTSKDGAAYHYAVNQFPEMIKAGNKISYYDLSKDKIDHSCLPKRYEEDFNNKVANKGFIEKTNLKKFHNINEVTTPENHKSYKSFLSNTTLFLIASTAMLYIASLTMLSLSLFDVVNININWFVLLGTVGAASVMTGISASRDYYKEHKEQTPEIDSTKSVTQERSYWRSVINKNTPDPSHQRSIN